MKVLVLNGSPRPHGDTAYVLEALKKSFPCDTEFEVLNAYEANIQPCNDCRYCWENEGCSINDKMNNLWKDDYDVLVLASPLYMSFVTPPLFSIISRLNVVWSNRFFLKTPNRLKPKKGILILTGGGDGSPDPAISIAKTAFHFLNVHFDQNLDYIRSLNTNDIPVRDDPDLARQIDTAIKHLSGDAGRMKLVEPALEYDQQIQAYRKEFLDCGDSMDGTGDLRKFERTQDWIDYLDKHKNPLTVPKGRVSSSQFLFVREDDRKVVGMIDIRHTLNDFLKKYGGHIGYSVAPSERRKGYATQMLKATLPVCKELGIDKVLITCIKGNEGSKKTILNNGGVYETTVHEPDENVDLEKYWITL